MKDWKNVEEFGRVVTMIKSVRLAASTEDRVAFGVIFLCNFSYIHSFHSNFMTHLR